MATKNPIQELKIKLENPGPILKSAGKMMQGFVQRNIETEGANLGSSWTPLSPSYARAKARAGHSNKMLVRDGNLIRTIISSTPIVEAQDGRVRITASMPYAQILHTGGTITQAARSEVFLRNRYKIGAKKGRFKKGTSAPGERGISFGQRTIRIPARPYFILAEKDVTEIKNEIIRWVLN